MGWWASLAWSLCDIPVLGGLLMGVAGEVRVEALVGGTDAPFPSFLSRFSRFLLSLSFLTETICTYFTCTFFSDEESYFFSLLFTYVIINACVASLPWCCWVASAAVT